MLTEDEIDVLKDKAQSLTNSANKYAIQEICRQLAQVGKFNSASEYKLWQTQKMGVEYETLVKEIAKRLSSSEEQIKEMHSMAARALYNSEVPDFTRRTLPFEKNTTLQQIIRASAELATKDFSNLTQTMGMIAPDELMATKGKELPLDKFYTKSMDWVFNQVSTGMLDHSTAVRLASKLLTNKGITAIHYQSGVVTSLEAAVRRNVMGGLGLLTEKVSGYNHEIMGATGWEISAHSNSAPDHEPYQGKQYTSEEWAKLNGTDEKPGELKRRIGTLNCGHVAFPIIIGVNLPQYNAEQLKELRKENQTGIEYEGKHYTGYEAKQRQRAIERQIRFHKKRLYAAQGAEDKQLEQQEQIRLMRLRNEYTSFSKAAGLKTQENRLMTAQFGKEKQTISGESGTITENGLYRITGESITNAHVPKSEVLDNEGNEYLQEYSKQVLSMARDEPLGTECAMTIRLDDYRHIKTSVGEPRARSVIPPKEDMPHYMIHNHPSGLYFSPGDVRGFISRKNMRGMVAIGNNGNGFLMEKLEYYDKDGFDEFFKKISTKYKNDNFKIMNALQEECEKYGIRFK